MMLRDELKKLLNTNLKIMGGIGAPEPWVKGNRDLTQKLRDAWTDSYRGLQNDEAYFCEHAKKIFGLQKPEEIDLGWQRTPGFLLPPDFRWPEADSLRAEKTYLREAIEMGMFPKEASGFVDKIFAP